METDSLTIVFSTRDENLSFIKHLKDTSGINSIEILQFVNKGEYSLTEIYNKGLKEAKNDIVVFSHDDIILDDKDIWGKKILQHFNNSDFGIIGKAGTTSLTKSGRWWDEPHFMVGEVWHQQTDHDTGKIKRWENKYSGNFGNRIIETIIIDGLFFAVHKRRLKKHFDEDFKGFHFYDIDFSFANHLAGVKIGVVFNFGITHKSIGITNQQWEINRAKFVSKWNNFLPYSITPEIIYDNFRIELSNQPKIAIIIREHNSRSLLRCIKSISKKTSYKNYKIYIAGNNYNHEISEADEDILKENSNIIFIDYRDKNIAKTLNYIVRNHIDKDTELILFCEDKIELLNDSLSRFVEIYNDRKHLIGTMGIRLHTTDNKIYHAGISLYVDNQNRLRIYFSGNGSYYSYNPGIQYYATAITGSFMLVSKEVFFLLGGFAEYYQEAFYDIEFNLRAIAYGKINCFIGDAVAYYYPYSDKENNSCNNENLNNDFQKLINFINQNLNNRNMLQHIHFL